MSPERRKGLRKASQNTSEESLPGEVFIPVPGLKHTDLDERGYPVTDSAWSNIIKALTSERKPRKKRRKKIKPDHAGWFKRTFLSGEKSKKGVFTATTAGIFIVTGVVEHRRGWRDVKDLSDAIRRSNILPRLKEMLPAQAENPRFEIKLMTFRHFLKRARHARHLSVSPGFYNPRKEGAITDQLSFGFRYTAHRGIFSYFYDYPIGGGFINMDKWENPGVHDQVEQQVKAQAERERLTLVNHLNIPDDRASLIVAGVRVAKEVREELLSFDNWSDNSPFDRI